MSRARMWRVFALVALVMYAVDVSTKVLALEKLEARHTEAVRREEDRAEQLVLDEIASRTAGRRPGAGADADADAWGGLS